MEYTKYVVSKVIGCYDKSFDKKPLISKWNKPFKNCKVLFNETGTQVIKVVKWDNIDVQVGDEFTGKIEEKEFNGNKYSELIVPKKEDLQAVEQQKITSAIFHLEKRLRACEEYIENHKNGKIPSDFSAEKVNKRTATLNTEMKEMSKNDEITADEIQSW